MKNKWWESAALIWDRSNQDRSTYWPCFHLDGDEHSVDGPGTQRCKLSYGQFIHLTAALTVKLRGIILQRVSQDAVTSFDERLLSVPIAVSIPEGPYLPLAIAAVHALNVPFSSSHGVMVSAVILPLDPSDGRQRLFHMLQETRPAIILTASDCDFQRMKDIAAEIPVANRDTITTDVIYRSPNVLVIDVRKKLREARADFDRSCSLLDLQGSLQRCAESDSLQKIIHNCTFELKTTDPQWCDYNPSSSNQISHLVFTSGSTGQPKGCLSSIESLRRYLVSKNHAHGIRTDSTVLLASSLTFDPCLSDILATLTARGTLALASRSDLVQKFGQVLSSLSVSHVLCTPTLWSTVPSTNTDRPVNDYPQLRVIALGGERIPKPIARAWARVAGNLDNNNDVPRLCATFGVTEACVYQTFGEVLSGDGENAAVGQDVGFLFPGLAARICLESRQDALVDVARTGYPDGIGEVVLSGNQLDEISSYLLRPDLTAMKFVYEGDTVCYRTGDRGYICPQSMHLHIMGRIEGHDGMVKINGVRVELEEIEAALIDDQGEYTVVTDSIVVASQQEDTDDSSTAIELRAFVVLNEVCLIELGISAEIPESGLFCTESPLLALLCERCKVNARATPSVFIAIPRIPLSPTGKRYRLGVPLVDDTVPLTTFLESKRGRSLSVPLREYGRTGSLVANEIAECLNIRPSQEALLSTTATFAMLGGDSLTATRVVRAIFARHHHVVNSRFIGGQYGSFEGRFAVVHLLAADNLGAYVNWLDMNGVCEDQALLSDEHASISAYSDSNQFVNMEESLPTAADFAAMEATHLFDALLQATSSGYTNIAMALLDVGADPNFGEPGGRLSKTSGRYERMRRFRSSPLHLACLQGMPILVKKLLDKKAKYNSPNASSLFPLHLAAAGEFHESYSDEEDERRLLCVKYLLEEAGSPLSMKDGSKQTILHAAARAGHVKVLRFALEQWVKNCRATPGKESSLDWRDNWSRTPVHWAVLNGKVDALAILIEKGCSANPRKPKESHRRTSSASESPMEICTRLYGKETELGRRIASLLQGDAADSTK